MSTFSLTITSDDPGVFRWIVFHVDGERVLEHTHSECEFESYESALNAGTLALAAADGRDHENEVANPVGNADCAAGDAKSGSAVQPMTQALVSR